MMHICLKLYFYTVLHVKHTSNIVTSLTRAVLLHHRPSSIDCDNGVWNCSYAARYVRYPSALLGLHSHILWTMSKPSANLCVNSTLPRFTVVLKPLK